MEGVFKKLLETYNARGLYEYDRVNAEVYKEEYSESGKIYQNLATR